MNSLGLLIGLVWSALGERISPAPEVDIVLEIMIIEITTEVETRKKTCMDSATAVARNGPTTHPLM